MSCIWSSVYSITQGTLSFEMWMSRTNSFVCVEFISVRMWSAKLALLVDVSCCCRFPLYLAFSICFFDCSPPTSASISTLFCITSLGVCVSASCLMWSSISGFVRMYFLGRSLRLPPCGANPGNVPKYSATAIVLSSLHDMRRRYSLFSECFAYALCRWITSSGSGCLVSGVKIAWRLPFSCFLCVVPYKESFMVTSVLVLSSQINILLVVGPDIQAPQSSQNRLFCLFLRLCRFATLFMR